VFYSLEPDTFQEGELDLGECALRFFPHEQEQEQPD
jgi:hypothetical protein